ncbi:MAG: YidC/Oxa1 family membrane protein insertase [Patescibacteria group bacterium]|jgi:YidC/Oxa1 family membrane protein insertase
MFHTILYQPLFNLLIWLYNVIPGQDLGFAIIGISLLVRLALWPLSRTSIKSQKALQDLQPKLEALKVEYKDNKEALAKAMMNLYKEEKVNPMSSCLPLLIQLPILWALYRVLNDGMNMDSLVNLYSFVARPESINLNFLGFINLAEPYIVMAILAGILQFIQTKMLMAKRPPLSVRKDPGAKDEDMMAQMNKSMLYFMPVMTVVIGATLPGGLTLYWIIMNLFAILQQALAFKKKKVETVAVAETK